jgi:glycosyltransferase involved in cell wall biosynthesis
MQQADCGVFPARAEGWNLEALEMMACGKPVITSNYSGHTEFANQFAVDVDGLQKAHDGKWFFGQGNWAMLGPDFIERFGKFMRCRYEAHRILGRQYCDRSLEVARDYTWEEVTLDLITEIFN